MRFERLDLLRYGGFSDKSIHFTASTHDLHVIHGPNEAGKSTTLNAIRDFLFGFPHTVEADWITTGKQLRVGGRLHDGTEVFEGIRRRGRSHGFYAPDDITPRDPLRLEQWLGGLDAKSFEASWSLDHLRLRSGGDAMSRLKDDAGKQILTAGLGVANLDGLMKSLKEEASKHWAKKAYKNTIATARSELVQLSRNLKTAPGTVDAYQAARATRDEARKTVETRAAEQRALDARRRDNERVLRNIEHVAQFLALGPAPDPARALLSLAACDQADAILSELAKIRFLLADQRAELARSVEACDAAGPVPAIVADGAAIDALLQRARTIPQLRDSLAACRTRIATDEIWLEQFWTRHDAPPRQIVENTPFTRLQAMLEDRARLRATITHLTQDRTDTRQRLEAKKIAPDSTPALSEAQCRDLETCLRTQRNKIGLDEQIRALHMQIAAEETAQDIAITRLNLPNNGKHAVATLVLPPSDWCDDMRIRWHAAEQDIAASQDALRDIRHQIERDRHDVQMLERGGLAVSPEALRDVRAERDRLWHAIRSGKTAPVHEATQEQDRLTALLAEADRLADIRYDHAENSARLAACHQTIATNTLREKQTSQTLDAAKTRYEEIRAAWVAQLPEALHNHSPHTLPAWIRLRDQALSATETLAETRRRRTEVEARRQQARDALARYVPAPDATTLEEHLDRATACHDHESTLHRNDADRKREVRQLAEKLTGLDTALENAERAMAEWTESWTGLCTSCDFPGAAQTEDIHDVQQALNVQLRLVGEYRARAEQTHTISAFETESAALCARHDAPSLQALGTALATARATADTITRLNAALHDARTRHEATRLRAEGLERQRAAIFHEVAPLTSSPSDDGLRATVSEARETHAREARRSELRAIIAQTGRGRRFEDLLAEAQAQDLDTLEAEQHRITEETERLNARRETAQRALWDAEAALERIETGPGMAEISEQIAATEARLSNSASAYVSVRLQSLLLQHLIDRRRQEAHGPLLERAGRTFSRLTLGTYEALVLEDDSQNHVVIAGRRADDGRLVPVGSMSEGTRDQLFLALRLGLVEQALDRGIRLPFLADDLFVTFDEARAEAGLAVLAALSQRTQVLFFTHHQFLAEKAISYAPVVTL